MQKKITKLKRSRKSDWSPQKVAEYSLIITAQHTNSLSALKILFSLSVGGIGLLVSISNFLSFSSAIQIFFFGCSIILFAITIFYIIGIYGCKFDFLNVSKEKLFIKSTEEENILVKKEGKAKKYHKRYVFICALAFVFAIMSMAIFSGISIYEKYNS